MEEVEDIEEVNLGGRSFDERTRELGESGGVEGFGEEVDGRGANW